MDGEEFPDTSQSKNECNQHFRENQGIDQFPRFENQGIDQFPRFENQGIGQFPSFHENVGHIHFVDYLLS